MINKAILYYIRGKWSTKWEYITSNCKIFYRTYNVVKLVGNSVIICGIVPRLDNLDNKADEVINRLALMCEKRIILFISHVEAQIRVKFLIKAN